MNADEFTKRLTAPSDIALVKAAFGIASTVKSKAAEIRGDARLSDTAKRDDVRSMAMGNPLAHLKQLHSQVSGMAADVANLKKSFAPKQPDRADLFGELQRRELRDHVRSLPPEARLRAVMEDPALMEAVLLGHASLSGLSTHSEDGAPSQFDLVRQSYVEKTFGSQLNGVEARERVVETLDAAVKVAVIQFRNESGLSEVEIAQALG